MFMWSVDKKKKLVKAQKEDAVRRCLKGYNCKFIAREKIKTHCIKRSI